MKCRKLHHEEGESANPTPSPDDNSIVTITNGIAIPKPENQKMNCNVENCFSLFHPKFSTGNYCISNQEKLPIALLSYTIDSYTSIE